MSTSYLKQPVLTFSSSMAFSIAPGKSGAQTVDGRSIAVKYYFLDSLIPDSQSNLPPAVQPDPYTGFTSAHIQLGKETLGPGFLSEP